MDSESVAPDLLSPPGGMSPAACVTVPRVTAPRVLLPVRTHRSGCPTMGQRSAVGQSPQGKVLPSP